ncbi:HAD-IA family hydrolase [Methylopila sp. M107]|uniref:HAD-IA family hydrolase n=1 Tax=Methylopila sp. M107 TaxID=1101190 RepID=UPI0003802D00|nr:HAD-IA family hydrolase [Methylopila sp. M107]
MTPDPKMLIVFDVDGTLVDSAHAIVEAMTDAYVSHGLAAPSRAAIVGVVGLSVSQAVAELSREAPEHPVETLGAAFKSSFNRGLETAPDQSGLYPGAAELIERLSRRDDVLLGLATGNSRRGVARFIDRFGFEGVFVTTQSADDAPSKPHPAMIQQAAAEAGVSVDETAMIGDTTFDMEMARSAGARAIGVSWGYHSPDRLLAAGAERVLQSFDELLPALGLPDPARAA